MNADSFAPKVACAPKGCAALATRVPQAGILVWYQTVVLGVALAAIYSNLPIYSYILYPALLPKFFFFAIVFLIIPLLLIKKNALGSYLRSPFVLWATVLLALNLIHLASFTTEVDIGALSAIDRQMTLRYALVLTRIQYIVFSIFLGFVAFISITKSYVRIFVFLAALLPCTIVLDFAYPGLLYPTDTSGAVLGRAAAMYINPNMAGEAILLVFLLGCAVMKPKYRTSLFILAGAAIIMTFSRSSIIAWVLLWPILLAKKILPKSALVVMAIVAGLLFGFFGSIENYLQGRTEFDSALDNILARMDFFSNYKLNDDSSEERAAVIKAGWELFLQSPIFGSGAGATLFWSHRGSTHNQLLLLAAEYGVLGIGLWIWMVIILWRGKFFQNHGLQLAVAFLFIFMSMFTHLMLDSASYWLATFALVSVRAHKEEIGSGRTLA